MTATATDEVGTAPKASHEPAAGIHVVAVLAAARLSVELALAALAALAAACAYELATVKLMTSLARGAWWTVPLYGVDYVHREVVIMHQEPDSMSRRHREVNGACLLSAFVTLCAFPLAYMQILGASRRVCSAMVGAMALSYSTLELGHVVLGVTLFGSYQVVFGFMWLYAVLRVLCPSGSAVPRHALRQLLVVSIGNIFVRNVAQSHSVRVPGSRGHCMARKGITNSCANSQDLERFFNTFVVFNCIRELGRYFVNQSVYYLTVAEFPGSQLVNRDAALLLVVQFHIAIGIAFRLELSNFESEVWTVGTVAAQAVLEVVSRLTAVDRDAWTKRWARRLCGRRGGQHNTRLVVSASCASFAVAGAPPALAKPSTERLAEPGERRAVVGEYNSRVILVEMLSEYAGTGTVFTLV